ncbi:MAG: mannose-1-phosphate guanylyltransferase [Anaerolineae bacterium]|nr:mannose-1-phosphate guanylyltransferase [Anaerolineae bacterium]
MDDHLYAVIMAGGIGSRLWPRSRNHIPKQFLDLLGPQTMLQETVQRIEPLVPLSRLFVVVSQDHAQRVVEQVPDLPAENLLVEPCRRDTAPCIGLAATVLRRQDPAAVMAVLPADHYIADGAGFRQAMEAAARLAADDYLVTLGITPNQPHTGYGYIQRGALLSQMGELSAFQVRRFTEKPDATTAQQFVDSGEYYWNAGIFAWRAQTILDEMARLAPALAEALHAVAEAWGTPRRAQVLAAAWDRAPRVSIDYAVMEKAARVAVLPVDIGWDDIGNWAQLSRLLSKGRDNLVHGGGRTALVDTAGTYVYTSGKRLVATAGVHDLVIVDTPTALLVCHKAKAQAVKEIVDRLKAEGLEEYL